MKLFITGAAGYVGTMLCVEFSKRPDVESIFAIDKEGLPELLKDNPKIIWVTTNTSDDTWQGKAKEYMPDVVIHTAWQIRQLFGEKEKQEKWNIEGTDKVFDFAFKTPSVKKLIHFSTVASYGAFSTNTIEHRFTEKEPFRKTDYFYAEEKRIVEEHLEEKYKKAKFAGKVLQVFVVRPVSITGPRGRYMRVRFGLQAALSGQLKESMWQRLISVMVSFVPATPKWLRQFIHEDDVNDIIELLTFNNLQEGYEVFNICPPGPAVLAPDIAEAVGKKIMPVTPFMVRLVFFVIRNISFGRVPTSKGGWKSYSYPIAVDGSKITNEYGYKYKYESKDAFVKKEGRYMKYVKS